MTPRRPVDLAAVRAALARLDAIAAANPQLAAPDRRDRLECALAGDPGPGGQKSRANDSPPALPDTFCDVPLAAHRDSEPNEEP